MAGIDSASMYDMQWKRALGVENVMSRGMFAVALAMTMGPKGPQSHPVFGLSAKACICLAPSMPRHIAAH